MGYTLYWDYAKSDNPSKVFPADFVSKAKNAIKIAEKDDSIGVLGTWCGDEAKDELVTDKYISFNGRKPQHCETFTLEPIPPQGYWDCCKTNYKFYTIVCMEILQLALEAGLITNWSTDGGDDDLKNKWREVYNRNEGEQTNGSMA